MTPLYPQKLALTSPTGGGRSIGIVRSRTKATEFIDMLLSAVSVLVVAQSSSEIPEGLMNNPVLARRSLCLKY